MWPMVWLSLGNSLTKLTPRHHSKISALYVSVYLLIFLSGGLGTGETTSSNQRDQFLGYFLAIFVEPKVDILDETLGEL